MIEFKAKSIYGGNGRMCFAVELDRDTTDFKHLMNTKVKVDGEEYIVRGIEKFCHCPPWHKGENIGLLVEVSWECVG